MRCSKCGHAGAAQLPALLPLCDRCFCAQIEHRIRKNARVNRLFSKGDKLVVVGDLIEMLVKSIIKALPVTIRRVDAVPQRLAKGAKLVLPDTMDDIEHDFLKKMFSDKPIKKDDRIRLLSVITDREAERFASCKGLKFVPLKKDKKVMQLLDALEKKHAETRFSLLRSIKDIKENLGR